MRKTKTLFRKGCKVELTSAFKNGAQKPGYQKHYPEGSRGKFVGREKGNRRILILQMAVSQGEKHDGRIHPPEDWCKVV